MAIVDHHEEWSREVAAHALGALDAADRLGFEAHLRTCPTCQALLHEYGATVALLPLALNQVEPPTALREALLVEARRRQGHSVALAPTIWERIVAVFRPLSWGLAAALVVVSLAWNVQLQQQLTTLQQAANIDQRARVAEGPGRAIALVGTGTPGASAHLYLDADGRQGELAITGLPLLRPDRTYQLWFARPGQPTETGGAFRVNERGQALAPVVIPVPLVQVSAIAVTEEAMPASLRPTGEHLLDWKP